MKTTEYQPKTGERCHCKPGQARDNCPDCEGTGWKIDFKAIRARTKTEVNTVTGETRTRLTYAELGRLLLKAHGARACFEGYGTTDPHWVGRYGLDSGDIQPDGTLT